MHDPMTVAWEIKSPFKRNGYRSSLITIWHVDPEKDGSDDSCGWVKRARHGSKEVLKRIEGRFDFEFGHKEGDSLPGWFNRDGSPRLSAIAITLQMFFHAHLAMHNSRKKTHRFLSKHLLELLNFAENNIGSLSDSITMRYGSKKREYRIKHFSSIIYGYILRAEQPWYRHPRWHIHHWRFQIHPLQKLKRFLFERCALCGKGYSWGYTPCGNWSGDKTWHSECDKSYVIKTEGLEH